MKSRKSTSTKNAPHPSKCAQPGAKRIVIVDDHPLFRKGLEDLIHSFDGFAVCGEAGSAPEAMSVIRQIKPDLAIIDVSLPGANGIELIKNLRAEFARLPILILSMHDESLYALRSLRAGAQGYVMKQEALGNILTAITEVFAGRPYLSPAMSAKLITNYVGGAEGNSKTGVIDKLSDRELEILELIGRGHEVIEIARELHLSPKTVETHRAHIKEKLNLPNARQVARFAVQWLAEREA